ncbi:MAG: L-rhamnose mutarotase [Ruminococcus sp.]
MLWKSKREKNEYRQILGEIWPDLTAFLDQEKVHNFSIWNCDSLIFGYYETDENNEFSEEKKASIQALTSRIDHTFTWISTPAKTCV